MKYFNNKLIIPISEAVAKCKKFIKLRFSIRPDAGDKTIQSVRLY